MFGKCFKQNDINLESLENLSADGNSINKDCPARCFSGNFKEKFLVEALTQIRLCLRIPSEIDRSTGATVLQVISTRSECDS